MISKQLVRIAFVALVCVLVILGWYVSPTTGEITELIVLGVLSGVLASYSFSFLS
jgi:hypothetical protein